MNKKGFTLIELLAVIVILSLLVLLASTSVTKLVKESKEDLYDTQMNLIESAAKTWGAENIDKLPSSGKCIYIYLSDLKASGLIDSEITNPKTNERLSDTLAIKITAKTGKYGDLVTSYTIDTTALGSCEYVYATSSQ